MRLSSHFSHGAASLRDCRDTAPAAPAARRTEAVSRHRDARRAVSPAQRAPWLPLLLAMVTMVTMASTAGAQVAPPRRPATVPAQAPAARRGIGDDTATTSYNVGGVRVIHRRVTANTVVAANLYLLGGTRQVTDSTAGIEALLLEASERGTRKYSKTALRDRMARLGSAIGVDAGPDWTTFALRSTVAGFDSTWVLWADRLMAPRLDTAEVEQVRGQYLSAVRQRREVPDAQLEFLADSAAFAGHPYGISPEGTERSIERITIGELRRYQQEQTVKSRMLLVIVGNVERARVERLVTATLGRLPAGTYQWTLPAAPPTRAKATLVTESRQLPTNYIRGYFAGPPASSPDYMALQVATRVLSGRLFAEIRSRRNLTYEVSAPFVERALASAGLYVTTTQPEVTLDLMRQQVEDIQAYVVDREALGYLVRQFVTEYFLENETNSDQASMLARAELYRGDWRAADRFVDELRKVTPEDVRRVARTYLKAPAFAYIGETRRVTPATFNGF
jgi:zinc protease